MQQKRRIRQLISWLLVMGMIFTSIFPGNVVKAEAQVQSEEAEATQETEVTEEAEAYAIYPIPQSITYQEGEFTLSDTVAIVAEEGVDEYTKNFLKKILDTYQVTYEEAASIQEGKTNIVLGVQGSDGVAAAYVTENITVSDTALFEKTDAYVLDAADNCIVIQGKDADSVYYGVATLQMMFSSFDGEKFLNAHIEDYASVATRGYIEGFYGAWDFEERAELMRFAGNYKMNSYVYAAKGDAYHTSKWAELYPDDMLAEFQTLVEVGKETKVEFAWSVHLGSFFSGLDLTDTEEYESRYGLLIDKIEQLYGIGVRKFDVLNDDFGSGSHDTVVTVLNRLNADLKAMGCDSLVYCPQGYNQSWSTTAELEALKNLDEDITIYWTGSDVNSPVTQETVDFLTEATDHQPDFWLNYPVNEHAKSGIFLGDITYYARDNVTGLAGFHSNPCRYAYANEVGLYQLAALVWNNNNYSEYAQEVWESAFDYLQPEVKDSYLTIARNIANAPNSSRVPGFNESEYLKEKLENIQSLVETGSAIKANEEAQAIYAEFENILAAIADFRENCANQNLVAELEPWLKSLSDIANAGLDALDSLFALEDGNASQGWEKLSSASKYYDSMYTYAVSEDLADTYAKAGTKRLSPFVSKMINAAKNKLTPILNPDDDTVSPVLFAKIGGVEKAEDTNTQKMHDGDEATYVTWTTVQAEGDYYGLDLGRVITVRDVSILQGKTDTDHDIFHDAALQYSEDKETWTDIECTVGTDGHVITAEGLNIKARYIRYYLNTTGYNGKPDYWTYVREFTVNKKVEEHDRVYTNVESLKETPLTMEGAKVSVRDLAGLTLQPGEYIGVKLEEPVAVTGFAKELSNAQGLVLEYSYNEQEWTEAAAIENTVGVKYLRLMNKSEAAVTTDLQKIEMTIKYLNAEPELFVSTVTNGFSEGNSANLFDGDLSTYALTGSSQTQDTFITFDLGKMLEVHDVTAVTTDGAQRFYNAKLQISKDNSQWTDIAVVEDDSSVFEVPYRYVYGDGEGVQARYLRIYFTGSNSNALKLHEIKINENAAESTAVDEIVSSMEGNLQAAIDKDISTLFAASAAAGDYVEYRISENTNVTQVSVLQGAAGTAKAVAVTPTGNVELGSLSQSVNTFDTTEIAPITAVRIEWESAEEAAIHEIAVSRGTDTSDDIGTYVEPIVIGDTEQITNIALGKEVTVSGTGDGNKDNVNDADTSTKWDSNAIKDSSGADTGDAWIYIDLGETRYQINQVIVQYFNKIYPTSYELQVSDDAETWTTVTSLTKENNGATYPIDTIDLEEAVVARYVRLYFNSVNTAAAGNGIGVQEFEIYGKKAAAITEQQNIGLQKTVTVSGTSNGQASYINDGDSETKWDSNLIKGSNATSTEAWFAIDLGEQANLIDGLNVKYFNKVYPTVYEVQISNDNENWTTVKTLSREHDGATYPVDEIVFETPVNARYLRMLFTEMNTAAAGNGIGILEAEVLGRYIYENVSVAEVINPADIYADKGSEFDAAQLSPLQTVKLQVKGLEEEITVQAATIWDVSELNMQQAATYTLNGALQLNGIANPEEITAQVKVIVQGDEPTNPDDTTNQPTNPDDSTNQPTNPGDSTNQPTNPDDNEPTTPGGDTTTPGDTTTEVTLPKKGEKLVVKGAAYKVLTVTAQGGTVSFAKPKKNAKTVTIPTTITVNGITYKVTTIDKNAFKGNKKVEKVTIGNNVTTIGANAFFGCTALTNVKIGNNVTTINTKAFYGCKKLASITLPKKVKKIGASVFTNCKKLKKITIQSTKLNKSGVAKNVFKGLGKSTTIKVPKAKLKAYKKLFKSKGLSSKVKVK